MQGMLPEGVRGRVLAVALAMTLLAVVWVAFVSPLAGWYQDRGNELARQRVILAHMQAATEMLPVLKHEASEVQPTGVQLVSGATDAVAGAALQEKVQAMAATSGASLSSVETLPAAAHGPYRQIGLRVSLMAPWPVLIALLVAVDRAQPSMLVDELQVRAGPIVTRSASSPVNASFEVLAYRAEGAKAAP